jgi:hypothetical protein
MKWVRSKVHHWQCMVCCGAQFDMGAGGLAEVFSKVCHWWCGCVMGGGGGSWH